MTGFYHLKTKPVPPFTDLLEAGSTFYQLTWRRYILLPAYLKTVPPITGLLEDGNTSLPSYLKMVPPCFKTVLPFTGWLEDGTNFYRLTWRLYHLLPADLKTVPPFTNLTEAGATFYQLAYKSVPPSTSLIEAGATPIETLASCKIITGLFFTIRLAWKCFFWARFMILSPRVWGEYYTVIILYYS